MSQDGLSTAGNILAIVSTPFTILLPLVSLWKYHQLNLNFESNYNQRLATISFLRLQFQRFDEKYYMAYPWMSLSQERRDHYEKAYQLIHKALKEADIMSAAFQKGRSRSNITGTIRQKRSLLLAVQNKLERLVETTASIVVRTKWVVLQQDCLDANIHSASTQLQHLEREFLATVISLQDESACPEPHSTGDTSHHRQSKSSQKTGAAGPSTEHAPAPNHTSTKASSLSYKQVVAKITKPGHVRLGHDIKLDRHGANAAILAALPTNVSYNGCKIYLNAKGADVRFGNSYTFEKEG